ncbi:MAG: TRM11 family SAM-dependent methyltransferase [Patescibacteria group bacterium]
MQYFFIFGNTPALSFAELQGYFQRTDTKYQVEWYEKDFVIVETIKEISQDVMNQLGGVVKFGKVVKEVKRINDIKSEYFVEEIHHEYTKGKYHFGFSVYPRDKNASYELRGIGLDIKKHLKELKIQSRLVMSRQENLSSVVVQKNKLVSELGWEIVILKKHHTYCIGRTIAVQPFEAFGERDFGRPGRDDKSGMLPPKVAMSMINLAAKPLDKIILDPFCGSGTVLQEALLLGYSTVHGSDASTKAIKDSKENIKWLADKHDVDIKGVHITEQDASKPRDKKIEVDAVVTEPFLGPPASGRRTKQEVDKIVNDLRPLYQKSLENLVDMLKENGRIVMIFPVLFFGKSKRFMSDEINFPKSLSVVSLCDSQQSRVFWLTRRGGVIYMRPGQAVGREIIVLEKK